MPSLWSISYLSRHLLPQLLLFGQVNYCVCLICLKKWVIDTSASDHTTRKIKYLSSLQSSSSLHSVTFTDCSITNVKGIGSVQIMIASIFVFYLYIPSFFFSIMSINKIIHSINDLVAFHPDSFCIFQDLRTKKVIGEGYEHAGFYYLNDSHVSTISHSAISSISPLSSRSSITRELKETCS